MDWSKSCPQPKEVKEYFLELQALVLDVEYDINYPRVEAIIQLISGELEVWAWDRWHGMGYWHMIITQGG